MQKEMDKLQAAVEAILFTMGESVEVAKIASAIGHDEETTRKPDPRHDGTATTKKTGASASLNWKTPFSCARKRKCTNI